ncbi:MAG TPA: hypothetical protein VM681_09000 [Candidatus Thermoplasmatota archaeon]|nr:hypothetical protein [Candidatus Thermoplasmatota archaeon]
MEKYDSLKAELPSIANAVSLFPAPLQLRVMELMFAEFLADRFGAKPAVAISGQESRPKVTSNGGGPLVLEADGRKEIPGIAVVDGEGKLALTIRDPKASSASEAAKRIAYVTIRASQLLTGSETVSSKETVVPALREWRLLSGGIRQSLASDRGLHREGRDLLWLDKPAQSEADEFIKQILDPNVSGSWKPGRGRSSPRKNGESTSDSSDESGDDDTGEESL